MKHFFSTLRELEEGSLLMQLDNALAAINEAVRATGKTGELTVKIKVNSATRRAGSSEVLVNAKVSHKIPEPDVEPTFFFLTDSNELTRQHPKQMELPGPSLVSAKSEDENDTEAEEKVENG